MDMMMMLSFVVVATVLGMVGRGMSKMVFGTGPRAGQKGWRGVFYVTMWAHPIVAGGLIGLTALPAPQAMGDATIGAVLWYAVAGGFSHTVLRAVESALKQRAAKVASEVANKPGPYSK